MCRGGAVAPTRLQAVRIICVVTAAAADDAAINYLVSFESTQVGGASALVHITAAVGLPLVYHVVYNKLRACFCSHINCLPGTHRNISKDTASFI